MRRRPLRKHTAATAVTLVAFAASTAAEWAHQLSAKHERGRRERRERALHLIPRNGALQDLATAARVLPREANGGVHKPQAWSRK